MHKDEHKKGVATTQQVGEEQEQKKGVAAEEEDVMDIAEEDEPKGVATTQQVREQQGTNGTDDQSLY